MDGITFQFYPGKIYETKPTGFISLPEFIELHKSPPGDLLKVFDQIRKAAAAGDDKRKGELKQNNLRFFTPCVHVSQYRKYENIVRFTGLLVLDFDRIDNATEFKEYLFETYTSLIAAWLSPSRRGVKALVLIPIVETPDQFKEYYFGIAAEMDQYNGFDHSDQNSVHPLFQSYDPDLLFRPDPDTWDKKGSNPKAYDYTDTGQDKTEPVKVDYSDRDRDRVIKITTKAISKITETPGHTRLRAAAIALGGFVQSGYITEGEAVQLIFNLIENNRYLQKGIHGYKKTAQWGLHEGKRSGIKLEHSNY